MVSFHELSFHKKQSVYLQIITYVKKRILADKISDHEEMPSRRELAVQLSVNPNTIQKAYKILEEEGIITTIGNVKSVVVVNDEIKEHIRTEFLKGTIEQFISECRDSGLSFQKTIELLTLYWDA